MEDKKELIEKRQKEYFHELVDRTNLILNYFQISIVEHEAIANDLEAQEKCEAICEKIGDLYQFFGQRL